MEGRFQTQTVKNGLLYFRQFVFMLLKMSIFSAHYIYKEIYITNLPISMQLIQRDLCLFFCMTSHIY